jgi:hypothetical protein
MNALPKSKIQSEVYSKDVVTQVLSSLKILIPKNWNIANVGIESASTTIQVTISGVPVGELVRDNQLRYLEDTTELFLDKFTGNMAVFDVDTTMQSKNPKSTNGLRNLLVEEDSGKLNCIFDVEGAYPVGASIDDFNGAIIRAFQVQADIYVSLLKQNGIRPGEMSYGDGVEYFQGIDSIVSSIVVEKAIDMDHSTAANDNGTLVRNILIGIAVNICVVLATVLLVWQIRKRYITIEKEKAREARREKRRSRQRQLDVKS